MTTWARRLTAVGAVVLEVIGAVASLSGCGSTSRARVTITDHDDDASMSGTFETDAVEVVEGRSSNVDIKAKFSDERCFVLFLVVCELESTGIFEVGGQTLCNPPPGSARVASVEFLESCPAGPRWQPTGGTGAMRRSSRSRRPRGPRDTGWRGESHVNCGASRASPSRHRGPAVARRSRRRHRRS
jgi:hypothetical protein